MATAQANRNKQAVIMNWDNSLSIFYKLAFHLTKSYRLAAVAVELPECPVCMETMTAPIYQCQSGHSLCNTCTTNLMPPICPICRQAMTQMRNWQLEELVAKAKVPCPNKLFGCVYTMVANDLSDHLNECIFREMDCPLGTAFGKCFWKGKLKDMMDHFKERHVENCNIASDADVEVGNLDIKKDDRHVYLVSQGKMLFIITMKIDTSQKMGYWAIQHIGSKKVAQQHIYEIHINSKQDLRRKVVFIDHCFNDAMKSDDVFHLGKCGVMPLENLAHFIKNKSFAFRFFIKRIPPQQKNSNKKDNNEDSENKSFKGPKGPGPKGGPKGPKFQGQGGPPKGPKKPNFNKQQNKN